MDGTPRMRSAFPSTPPRTGRNPQDRRPAPFARDSPQVKHDPLPSIPTLRAQPAAPNEPLIPTHIIEAPSQRLYAVAFWGAIWTWRLYDWTCLQESEEQSLWLFMKFVAIDGVFLFGLPSMRIPWLEWSSATMTLIFLAHAVIDAMLMFRIPLPIGAGLAFLWRGVWGAYETAVNEHNVNPDRIMFNESLILGRQVIHILPEGSAILNPEREAFCLDDTRTQAKLPIQINATNPISMELLRVDLDTQANETLTISKSQIKTMHKEASRLLSYNDDPNEPKTLYYSVKKPGLYVLQKVVDESNLEVSRKKLAHTVVVPCPKAAITTPDSDKCRGELSEVDLLVTGTPPLRVKYRKVVNKASQEATFENIQPEDLISPLVKQDHSSLVVPARVETEWAKPRGIRVPLSEGLGVSGRWVYAIDEVTDGFGNVMSYVTPSQDSHGRQNAKTPQLHQVITVHERPNVQLNGCTPQRPLKVATGESARLPVQFASTGRGELRDTPYHLEYIFSPPDELSGSGEHGRTPHKDVFKNRNSTNLPVIKAPGLYTITGVASNFCRGDVLEPAACMLENPPQPQLSITSEEIHDKCAGSPVGLRVDLDLIGTPPFEIKYRVQQSGSKHHYNQVEKVNGLRGQIELTPREAGVYTYEFHQISDAVYKDQQVQGVAPLRQDVKPAASARFIRDAKQVTCIDQQATAEVSLHGEAPFTLEYELVHGGKRKKSTITDINVPVVNIETGPLTEGGDYTLALVSILDKMGCKEFLKDEAKIAVRHQKPKASFGQIEGRRTVDILEGKKVQLPLRLAGEQPWSVKYLDEQGNSQTLQASNQNDRIIVEREGMYELLDVRDHICPGVVDEAAKSFQVNWIPRPELRVAPTEIKGREGNNLFKEDVCEGDEDAVEVLFKGSPPFHLAYSQTVKPDHGAIAPKSKDVRAALNVASLRMDTAQAGAYEYHLNKLGDANYDHHPKHLAPLTIRQRVSPRPSAAFTNPGKTYSFCSMESEGEEVIPVTLHGKAPFELEVEIKHHGTIKPELVHYNNIVSNSHNIRIPHNRLHLGKSAIALRRVSDSRGCARTLDSTTPRVQISVHDAPTITPLETQVDYCVGDRINFGLSGVAPFQIHYTFEGVQRKAIVSHGNTFKRLAEKPGTFVITGLQDSASTCRASTNLVKHIHGMPSVRVSKGKDSYVDIHEGGEAEILFEFGGTPPFEFTYTRSSNTEKGGKKGIILDMRSEISEEQSMRIWASEEGTYEVVAIKDAHCAYAKPGVRVEPDKKKRLTY